MIHNSTAEIMDKNKIEAEIGKFLSSGNLPHKEHIPYKGNQEIGTIGKWVVPEVLHNITTLTPTELRKKYPRSYKCWDNMKQRKHKGAIIHPEFDKFADFLRQVGPCENKNYTLDRLNNDDPEYASGKVEWRDKFAQNSNKGDNIYLTHDDGRKRTVAQWAKITKQKPSTLYKRHKAGWSDMEIITGKKFELYTPSSKDIWPYKEKQIWEKRYRTAALENGFKDTRLAFLEYYSKIEFFSLRKEKEMLDLAIQQKKGFGDDIENAVAFEMYLMDKV